MKNIPGGHNLFFSDKETANVIENLYSKFKLLLTKQDEVSSKSLLTQLKNIDRHLEARDSRFLTGNTMCCFDCELMPRLQHIRVAGKYFVNFEVPDSFNYLWKYMRNMYLLDAFVQSCPADQDIINHYKLQIGAPGSGTANGGSIRKRGHEELETPTYTMTIPSSVQ